MEKTRTSDGFIISDPITDLEDRFPRKELLALEYFTKYRRGYYEQRELGVQVNDRNSHNLLKFLAYEGIIRSVRLGRAECRCRFGGLRNDHRSRRPAGPAIRNRVLSDSGGLTSYFGGGVHPSDTPVNAASLAESSS
jgi:hypothetical protein